VENGVGYVKKNFLNGLELKDFSAMNPAAQLWLDTVANVRLHGETHQRPCDRFQEEQPQLQPLHPMPYDNARVSTVRTSKQFRVTLDTNRYSVPAEYASTRVTLKAYPERLCIYYQDKLIARHARSYDRHQDIEDPDHPKPLLAQRRHAREQRLLMRFLALAPKAQAYYQGLEQRRLNPRHQVAKILALSDIYGIEATAHHRGCDRLRGFPLRLHRQSPRVPRPPLAPTQCLTPDPSPRSPRFRTRPARSLPL
jgi:hypothetical protein